MVADLEAVLPARSAAASGARRRPRASAIPLRRRRELRRHRRLLAATRRRAARGLTRRGVAERRGAGSSPGHRSRRDRPDEQGRARAIVEAEAVRERRAARSISCPTRRGGRTCSRWRSSFDDRAILPGINAALFAVSRTEDAAGRTRVSFAGPTAPEAKSSRSFVFHADGAARRHGGQARSIGAVR